MKRLLTLALVFGACLAVAACEGPNRAPQLNSLQSNVDQTYEGDFGELLYNMYQAGKKAEYAEDAKAHLEGDPPYIYNHLDLLEGGVAASEQALEHRRAAEAALNRFLDPLRARIAYLESLHVPEGVGSVSLSVFFDTGSATVRQDQISKIEEAAAFLSQYPIAAVTIVGYTDTVGNASANETLSRRRAVSVVETLADFGVPLASTVAVDAAGEAGGPDNVENQANRRVDIMISPHGRHVQ